MCGKCRRATLQLASTCSTRYHPDRMALRQQSSIEPFLLVLLVAIVLVLLLRAMF
jgi:hypothetical protein